MALTSSRSFAESTGFGMLSNSFVRRGALATWDMMCWTLGAAFVIGLRYSFRITEVQWEAVLRYLVLSWVLLVVAGSSPSSTAAGSWSARSRRRSAWPCTSSVSLPSRSSPPPLLNPDLPRSLPVLAPPIALVGAAAGRWCFRAVRARGAERGVDGRRPVLIYGAGDAGRQVLRLVRVRPQPRPDAGRLPRRQPRQAPPAHPWRTRARAPAARSDEVADGLGRRGRHPRGARRIRRARRRGPAGRCRRPVSSSSSCPGWAT